MDDTRDPKNGLKREGLLNIREAAEMLGVTVSYLRMLRTQRLIPVVKIGRRLIRFKRSDLEAMIDEGYEPAENE